MKQILLPAQINPPRIRKDGSCSISVDTRELTSEEIFTIMSLRNSEGWFSYAPNPDDIEIPEEHAELDEKSVSERLRNVLYVLYKQKVEANEYTGLFETFRKERMEQIIEFVKKKLN
jgi:hypothetical protein